MYLCIIVAGIHSLCFFYKKSRAFWECPGAVAVSGVVRCGISLVDSPFASPTRLGVVEARLVHRLEAQLLTNTIAITDEALDLDPDLALPLVTGKG